MPQKANLPILLALLAALSVAYLPSRVAAPPAAEQSAKAGAGPNSETNQAPRPAKSVCPDADSSDTIRRFLGAPQDGSARLEWRHLVVTIPDPVATNLAAMFDSMIESVEAAAQLAGFQLDRYWLPWDEQGAAPPDTSVCPALEWATIRRTRAREPGVLVFRGAGNKRLAVYLIGESPASGINRGAFTRAIEIRNRLGVESKESLDIAGPSFSGSIPSLREAIQQHALTQARVRSGTATRADNKKDMLPIDYESLVENDTYAIQALMQFLKTRQRIPPRRIAMLTEIGTAFGASAMKATVVKSEDALVHLTFPRNIARLRNAYQDDPALRSLWSVKKEAQQPRETLDLTLKDPVESRERIAAFAPAQTARLQEIVLENLADTLRIQDVQVAGLAATDILDALFLTRWIEQRCPNVRVFTLYSDVYFQHSSSSGSFYGMQLVTTYPLFSLNQVWQRPKDGNYEVTHFASSSSQGLYNACLLLLKRESALVGHRSPVDRGEVPLRPPLWLTVVGREGLWPIALLPAPTAEGSGASTVPELHQSALAADEFRLPEASRLWHVLVWLALGSTFWHLFLVFRFRLAEWQHKPAPAFPTLFELPEKGGAQGLFFVTVLEGLAIGLLSAVVRTEEELGRNVLVHATLSASWAAMVLLVFSSAVRMVDRLRILPKEALKALAAILPALALAGGAAHCWRGIADDGVDMKLTALRSVFPASGVSPALPLILLLVGLLAWCGLHLQALRLQESRSPEFPRLDNFDVGLAGLFDEAASASRLAGSIVGSASVWGASIVALAAAWAAFRPIDILGLENYHFDHVFAGALFAVLFSILITLGRFLVTWIYTCGVLYRLESSVPMMDAFRRIVEECPEIADDRPWRRSGKRMAFVLLVASLKKMEAARAAGWQGRRLEWLRHRIGQVLSDDAKGYREDAKVLRALRLWLTVMATRAASGQLEFYTRQTRTDFIAIRVTSFLRYILVQLRHQIEFLSTGIIVLLLSILTYPVHPHRTLVVGASVIVAVVGSVVITVFWQMDRNAILSVLSRSAPGKVSGGFYLAALRYGAAPLLALLVTQFPQLGHLVSTLAEPVLKALQ